LDHIVKKTLLIGALCAVALAASPAIAGPVKTKPPATVVVQASAADVTLETLPANSFIPLGALNAQGNKGDAAVTAAFGGEWDAIGAFKGSSTTEAFKQVTTPLDFDFFMTTDKSGTWSVKNSSDTHNITLDLVFAMHAGNNSGAWLFNSSTILAGETLDGTWIQRLLNGGGNAAGFSNVTFFARNLIATKITVPADSTTDVPEPATLGTLMLGLGMIGFMARRRKQS
jgi:hypothetical protein